MPFIQRLRRWKNLEIPMVFYLHAYTNLYKYLTFGGELKYSIPEERDIKKKDIHILIGAVFHPTDRIDISLGLHKSLNRDKSFSN